MSSSLTTSQSSLGASGLLSVESKVSCLSKKLRFRDLEVIEFPMVLGNNPAVSQGAPLAMGDEELSRRTVDLYHYEILVGEDRRRGKDLIISVPDRAAILIRSGYTINEIVDSAQAAENDRKLREESLQQQKWDKVSDIMQRTGRKVKKVFSVTAKSA